MSVTSPVSDTLERPQVLVLHKDKSDALSNDFFAGLGTNVELHHMTVLPTAPLNSFKAILVIDKDFYKDEQKSLQIMLSKYAKNGGTVVLACAFSDPDDQDPDPGFASMCQNMELGWGRGGLYQSYNALNADFASVFANEAFKTLEQSIDMVAMHLIDVDTTAKVYVRDPLASGYAEWRPDRVDAAMTPAVWQKHGQGHIAYIGNVNYTTSSRVLIIAMLNTVI